MPAPPVPPPAPGGQGQTLAVNKDNVLAVGKAISDATDTAYRQLDAVRSDLVIRPSADDNISVAAATEWNRNLLGDPDSHYQRLKQYIDNVRELTVQLADAAKQYGYSDEEIAASFASKSNHV